MDVLPVGTGWSAQWADDLREPPCPHNSNQIELHAGGAAEGLIASWNIGYSVLH